MPLTASDEDAATLSSQEQPSSIWKRFGARVSGAFSGADPRVCVAFWLFGLVNNVLYVIILSAAVDLVGPDVPKGVVLLADVVPSFTTKLFAPYFIHLVPYWMRILVFAFLSSVGMLVVAMSPGYTDGGTISSKIAGIILASFSSGAGELSFVGLTHFYGPFSLAAWGSGTGAAGLIGAGAYALATSALGLSVHVTLLASACLPAIMILSFFVVLPLSPLRSTESDADRYLVVEGGGQLEEDEIDDHAGGEREGLLGVSHNPPAPKSIHVNEGGSWQDQTRLNLQRIRGLFIPFMVPMLLVYIAEYVINQGVAPTLLFPLRESPFEHFRSFYPTYNAIYQIGVFISRSSTPFYRIHNLYLPSLLQVANLTLLTLHALFNFIPSVWLVFIVVFWEGLLGGVVYVNTFAEIADRVPKEDREFSLGATTVSDSAGICIAGFLNHVLGRPSTRFRKIQVFAVVSFWSVYLLRADKHGPPFIRSLSSRFTGKLTTWQTTVIIFLWLYLSRNFAKIVGLECPEPLANMYSRSFFRATWITTGLDAGFWTAMNIKPKWLRDIASLVFTAYYLIAAEQADEKVRRVRATLTLEHLRVSWNKATSPYLWSLAKLLRPRMTQFPARAIRIPRPAQSVYTDPVHAWLYFDGPLSALRDQSLIVLDVPGGGFVAMSPRNSEDKLLSWAGRLKVPILSVDYKKAPEFAYPYALHECYDVYHSIIATNGRCMGLGGKTRPRILVTGESAGGNLAVGMTLMVLQSAMSQGWQGEDVLPAPDGVVLGYPALNMKVESWMSDEQMSLIQEKSTRQTNRSVLQRKQDEYRKLTPFTSPGGSVEDLTAISPPEKENDNKETNIATQAAKSLEKKVQKNEDIAPNPVAKAKDEVKPIKTRLAVSSMITYVHDRILTPEMTRAMIILYIGPHHRPDFNTDFFLSPVLAPDELLARFPKTYIMTGERDPLVDDTVVFAGRLRQAKLHHFRERQDLGLERANRPFNERNYIEVSLIPGISHGFMQMAGFFPDAWKYIHRSADWLETLFQKIKTDNFEADLIYPDRDVNALNVNNSLKLSSPATRQANATNKGRNHRRKFTGESSGDDDRPLEMSTSKITSAAGSEDALASKSDHRTRRRRSLSSFASSRVTGFTSLGDDRNAKEDFLAKLRCLERAGRSDPFDPDEINSAPESPGAFRPRGRSIASLDSEEDLLDRRMNGLAGGLMGIGEGAQTPGL
ncbi:Alpha/beta hydrolase fold-3 [Penicillium italicum]|uniref:Alpha/beta hydrolase fold-3 n=1 Tax=Penicillium italicum TaxID=40296 RepID=A0A0A2L1I1_PENIT|nr:Alpha/beta hydrolase fold-3 [Penicillium italicum]